MELFEGSIENFLVGEGCNLVSTEVMSMAWFLHEQAAAETKSHDDDLAELFGRR